MLVKVIENHDGEGEFPTFKKGTKIELGEACSHFLHWYACTIDNHQTYIPESYLDEGVLNRDYNPTELVQKVGDELTVIEIVNSWLLAVNDDETMGWIPAESVVSD
ncbi:MAG: SH3 domain-containing protein [Coprobacillaceae bacterium]